MEPVPKLPSARSTPALVLGLSLAILAFACWGLYSSPDAVKERERDERERDDWKASGQELFIVKDQLDAAQAREAELQNSLRHALIFQDMQRTAEKLLRAPGSTDALEAFAVKCIERSHRFKYDDSKAVVREVLKGEG